MKADITYEEALWEYLIKKLSILDDNNKTARDIYNWIMVQNGKSLKMGGLTEDEILKLQEDMNAVGNEHTRLLNEMV